MKTRRVITWINVLCYILTFFMLTNNRSLAQSVCIGEELENDFPSGIAVQYKTLAPQCYTQYTGRTYEMVPSKLTKDDISIHMVNTTTNGQLSSNDAIITEMNYSTPILITAPEGSTPTLNLSSDGTYQFITNKKGDYRYEIQSCKGACCETTILTILAIDKFSNKTAFAHADYTLTDVNKPVVLATLANDACLANVKSTIDPSSLQYITIPKHGVITQVNNNYAYIPDNGFIGSDSILYKVCANSIPSNCDTSIHIIKVEYAARPNDIHADDDFEVLMQDSVIVGNVLDNDYDPQSNSIVVTTQVTNKLDCIFDLKNDGSYTFTPGKGFYGSISFDYMICDDHPTESACDKASIQFMVMTPITVNVRTYLQGPLYKAKGFAPDGRVLMDDHLRVSPFNGKRFIPLQDPYQFPVLNASSLVYDLSADPALVEKFKEVGCGTYPQFMSITDTAIFNVTGQDAIVDWIFVELRNKDNNKDIIATRAGLLQRDGDVVDLDGHSALVFPDVELNNYYVCVKHRNHFGIMSKNALSPETYTQLVNFTTSAVPTYDKGIVNNINYTGLAQGERYKHGYNCMFAGDFDANGLVKADGEGSDLNVLIIEVVSMSNNTEYGLHYDSAIGYFGSDYDMNSKIKYDNPYDDKKQLLGQVFFYNGNFNLLSNFDGMIEQLP